MLRPLVGGGVKFAESQQLDVAALVRQECRDWGMRVESRLLSVDEARAFVMGVAQHALRCIREIAIAQGLFDWQPPLPSPDAAWLTALQQQQHNREENSLGTTAADVNVHVDPDSSDPWTFHVHFTASYGAKNAPYSRNATLTTTSPSSSVEKRDTRGGTRKRSSGQNHRNRSERSQSPLHRLFRSLSPSRFGAGPAARRRRRRENQGTV